MTLINTNNAKLVSVLSKYSYSQLVTELKKHINKTQVDSFYLKDLNEQENLINNMAMRLESLALVCCDLNDKDNVDKIHKQYYFYWGSSKENAQMRGIQAHYAGRIFSEITLAANTDFTKISLELSAENLGISPGLNTNIRGYIPRMKFPAEFQQANHDSLKNAFEVTTGTIHSSVTGDLVIFTGDKPTNLSGLSKKVINNIPKGQVNNDINRDNRYALIKEEFKTYTKNKVLSSKLDPKVVNVGKLDPVEEKNMVMDIASSARVKIKTKPNAIINVDPNKNNNVTNDVILAKVQQTGDITDARELLGISVPYSNRFINPNIEDD